MSYYTFEVIDKVSNTMYDVAIAEQKILKDAIKYKPKKRFGGYTECIKNIVNIQDYVPSRVGHPIQEDRADNDISSN